MNKMPLKLFSLLIATALLLSPMMVLADDVCHGPDCARQSETNDGWNCCQTEENFSCCQEAIIPLEGADAGIDLLVDAAASANEKETESKNPGCHCSMSAYCNSSAVMPVGAADRATLLDMPYQHIPASFTNSGWIYQILHPPR